MAAYVCELEKEQQIYIENQRSQTLVKLSSSNKSQQQSQSNYFETGNWRVPPTVFRTSNGVLLQIETEQSQHFIQLQANGMIKLDSPPSLSDSEVLPLQKVEADVASKPSSMSGMQPMSPMKPMQPMHMQMGNMEMRMGTAPEQKQSAKNFCPQCGSKVGKSDRFCSNCGNSLAPFEE